MGMFAHSFMPRLWALQSVKCLAEVLLPQCLPLYVDLPDFGIPIHLGVLFMYSR